MSVTDSQSPTTTLLLSTLKTPYRCYLMDEIGHVLALAVVNSNNEASAVQQAASKFRQDPECRIIEVWEIGRRIVRLRRADAAILRSANS